MHNPRIERLVEGLGRGGIWMMGVGGVACIAAVVPAATPWLADLGLAAAGTAAVATAGWAWSVRRQLGQLPLQLGPIAARGQVDGAVVYRVRAQLGRGRPLRDPAAEARWIPASGEPLELPVAIAATSLVGPFTILVHDPTSAVCAGGTLEVRVVARSDGQHWEAQARYPVELIAPGRFAGVSTGRRGLVLGEDWTELTR